MDPVTLLIVAIVAAAVGYIAGILIGRMGKKPSHTDADSATHANPPTQAADGASPSEQVELAAFYRVQVGAPLSVRLGNSHWDSATQVPGAQLTALESLLGEYQRWLKPYQNPTPAPVAPVPEAAAAAPATPVFVLTPPPPAPTPAPSGKQPFIEAKTIVAQIDDILQEILPGSPYAGRKIYLTEVPKQGVVVVVDHNQYPGIDAVPDQDIRSLIRQAVSTWEKRSS